MSNKTVYLFYYSDCMFSSVVVCLNERLHFCRGILLGCMAPRYRYSLCQSVMAPIKNAFTSVCISDVRSAYSQFSCIVSDGYRTEHAFRQVETSLSQKCMVVCELLPTAIPAIIVSPLQRSLRILNHDWAASLRGESFSLLPVCLVFE